ncbi:Ger(x)C family spore germination protein [Paenibacillus oceani]|uniref:Ger(X)C family spore germination protein n=1 Tax=Paenibacillus oceani TaxID=2772510 RepID=A0A927H3M1_9BACL|nr:Ger(x)C family spore germination protein [Paenibacillus oceani]MBD2866477.1 Ger(x)C family spore germination protein [Paenibacillus oceani]
MKRITATFAISILTIALLSGCWNRRELNDLSIALGVGIDKQGEKYQISIQIVNPQEIAARKGGGDNSPVTIYDETGKTMFEIFRRMTTHTPRKIYMSHLRMLIISEEVAKEGIQNILDVFARDHEMRTDFYVIIARDTEAKQVLSILQPLEKVPANFLYKTLQTSESVWAPTVGVFLDELMTDLMTTGKEATLTGVRVMGEAEGGITVDNLKTTQTNAFLKYSTIGVFRKDKLVGWLNEEESKGYNYIVNRVKSTVGVLPCPGGGQMDVEVIRTKTKLSGKLVNGKPEITLDIRIDQNVGEVACNIDISDLDTLNRMDREGEKKIKSIVEKTVQRAQKKYKADIFGFGEAIRRSNPKEWERLQKDWEQIFPKVPVHYNIQVTTLGTGTQSNSFINKMER